MFGRESNQGNFLEEEAPEPLGRKGGVLSAGWLKEGYSDSVEGVAAGRGGAF